MDSRYIAWMNQAKEFRVQVFALSKAGISQAEIARRLGVTRQRVNQIVHTKKSRARGIVNSLVKRNKIPKPSALKCVDCGKSAKEYDHRDYAKPKKVEPVCKPCHVKRTYPKKSGSKNGRSVQNI